MSEETASDKNVEIWKVKKLIKSLQLARGNGTSMISLIIPPGDQVNKKINCNHQLAKWKWLF
jgi:peptide chain release factor subunit 1